MPEYTDVPALYVEYPGDGTKTFVYRDKPTSIHWPPEKRGKEIEGRQAHFANQLMTLSNHFGRCIPIHLRWASGEQNQMDKGCIGHAFGPDLPIRSIVVEFGGEMTHVILWEADAQN